MGFVFYKYDAECFNATGMLQRKIEEGVYFREFEKRSKAMLDGDRLRWDCVCYVKVGDEELYRLGMGLVKRNREYRYDLRIFSWESEFWHDVGESKDAMVVEKSCDLHKYLEFCLKYVLMKFGGCVMYVTEREVWRAVAGVGVKR